MVVVQVVVAVALVVGIIDPAAQLSADSKVYEFVFDMDHGMLLVFLDRSESVVERIGVHASLNALMAVAFKEAGHGIGSILTVSRDDYCLFR